MMKITKAAIALFAAAAIFAGMAKAGIDAAKAEAFVRQTTDAGIYQIINADIPQAEKNKRFADLFNKALDLDFIGQFVLGRYWKTASDSQKKGFIAAYRELNVKSWSRKFDEFKGHNFNFSGSTPSNSEDQVFVNATVPMDQGDPAKVAFRVRDKNGDMKIVDIVIENISLAITARNEYAAFIKNNPGGLDALIADLQAKTKQM